MLRSKFLVPVAALTIAMGVVGCSTTNDRANNNTADVKTTLRNDLDAANLKDVKVDVDKDKNVVTLTGDAGTDEQKAKAPADPPDPPDNKPGERIGARRTEGRCLR